MSSNILETHIQDIDANTKRFYLLLGNDDLATWSSYTGVYIQRFRICLNGLGYIGPIGITYGQNPVVRMYNPDGSVESTTIGTSVDVIQSAEFVIRIFNEPTGFPLGTPYYKKLVTIDITRTDGLDGEWNKFGIVPLTKVWLYPTTDTVTPIISNHGGELGFHDSISSIASGTWSHGSGSHSISITINHHSVVNLIPTGTTGKTSRFRLIFEDDLDFFKWQVSNFTVQRDSETAVDFDAVSTLDKTMIIMSSNYDEGITFDSTTNGTTHTYKFDFELNRMPNNKINSIEFMHGSAYAYDLFSSILPENFGSAEIFNIELLDIIYCIHPKYSWVKMTDGSEKLISELVQGDEVDVYLRKEDKIVTAEVDRIKQNNTDFRHYVRFMPGSLSDNIPDKTLYLTPTHKIRINGKTVEARHLITKQTRKKNTINYIKPEDIDGSICNPIVPILKLETQNAFATVNGVLVSFWGYQNKGLLK